MTLYFNTVCTVQHEASKGGCAFVTGNKQKKSLKNHRNRVTKKIKKV